MSDLLGWNALLAGIVSIPELALTLDSSTMPVPPDEERRLRPEIERALVEMAALERGQLANRDENRMVGHYWLRAPELAPTQEIRQAIETAREDVAAFAGAVRRGEVAAPDGMAFERVLHVGIGGSALGPQLACDALAGPADPVRVEFLDNTDPDGIERTLQTLGDHLARTIGIVVSKSGGTKETQNGLELLAARLRSHGLDPARQLVAVTGQGSALDRRARGEGWLGVFPMWDWVGGRTSLTSAVGLLTMSLAGFDVDALLDGARVMDEATRDPDVAKNPAARLALCWHAAGGGAGRRDMVVIPYKDRLALFSRYLQQLVMESLGKERDLEGRVVRQGLTVYGNKGSTDQHAYIQQLREGIDNHFVTLIAVLEDGEGAPPHEVEPGIHAGDYLLGFLLGTRRALVEAGRLVSTIVVPRVDARSLGALVALFERTVGLYAGMLRINAYHQPGVEAGKRAAGTILEVQRALVAAMRERPGTWAGADAWAEESGHGTHAVEALWLLEHLVANGRDGVARRGELGDPGAEFSVTAG
ncbi:MAG: glucose-6-phosphate isomerase [Acidobacteriota bacterium]|nr:glucose-6-phosphate isomerase [Acidobacteriota bacterium]